MFDQPIRRKTHQYPKDFTPSQNVLNAQAHIRKSSVNSEEFSFSGSRKRQNGHINKSTQLQIQSRQDLDNNQLMFTINPEQANKLFGQQQKETPIPNQHLNRRSPYLNPKILARPRIQEKINYEIPEASETQGESCTPGSIKSNSKADQKPLKLQNPTQLSTHMHKNSEKKVQQVHRNFQDIMKANHIDLSPSTARKCASLGRGGRSAGEGSFRLTKKFSSPMNINRESNSLLMKNINENPEKKNLFSYGYLLEQNKMSKLKEHINQFVEQKSKHKNNRVQKHTQSDFGQVQTTQRCFNPKLARTRKILSASKFFPELGGTENFHHQQNQLQTQEACEYDDTTSPTPFFQNRNRIEKQFVVSYKSSLNSLKQILKSINVSNQNGKKADIQIRVPQILLSLRIDSNIDKSALYNVAMQLFQQLQIPPTNLNIKRYSNCVIMVAKSICIIYHYSQKVYLGGWQTMYLDQGVRHGLGLEWMPNRYVFYGQYVNNKRQGLGIYKQPISTYIGSFSHSQKTHGYTINSAGEVYNDGSTFRQNYNEFYNDEYMQSEPGLY